MAADSFPSNPTEFCITDVGSTTTKALLFVKRDGDWRFSREEAPTTVEKPHEDVTVGVLRAMRTLEQETDERLLRNGVPFLPYLSTSSAGGGLAMVVTGLVKDITAGSADRVALGAGAIVLDVIAMDDGRTPYRKIEDLKKLRPDMVLLAGGFDGDAISGPVFLAELVIESGLVPKLNPRAKLPVIYAGNVNAQEYVRRVLEDRYAFYPVPNVRPDGGRENVEPARNAIHELFMDHVMSQAPGYEKLKPWVSAPIMPTPAAFGNILGLVSKDLKKTIMAIDIGGATTDVFSVVNGKVFRTVSANLGMSYSILNAAKLDGIGAVAELLDFETTEAELWNRIGNKHNNPTELPATRQDMMIEWAVATVAIREAVQQHLKVIHGAPSEPSPAKDINELLRPFFRKKEEPERIELPELEGYDLIIGSGGILSHSPRGAAAMMLLDALQPRGVVELAVDSAFMFPHLGVLAEVNPGLARELFYRLGIVKLGTALALTGERESSKAVTIAGATSRGRTVEEKVESGEVKLLPLAEGEDLKVRRRRVEAESEEEFTVSGGVCGLIADARPRPIESRAGSLVPADYTLPVRKIEPQPEERIHRGEIRLRRELAIPGRVFVGIGDRVLPDTLVARSVRQFLRPFFLNVAEAMEVPQEELPKYLLKKVGDEIGPGEIIAKRPRRMMFPRVFRSPVEGRIEKILASGILVVREKPEAAREYTTVNVAKELGVEPRYIKPYLRCEAGKEVDRGQWLAAIMRPGSMKLCKSPVWGKVNRIDFGFGMVIIEPLLEELEVQAWLPGTVEQVSDRGCIVANQGVSIQGVWGSGPEVFGILSFDEVKSGYITVAHTASKPLLAELRERGAAGLIAGGLDLQDVLDPKPGFTTVVTEGFGQHRIAPDVFEVLKSCQGRLVLIDGTTQLRVGVKRPRIILPDVEK